MLTENTITRILNELGEKIKKSPKNEIPKADWGEIYKKSYVHAEEIEVHECGEFPEKLIGDNFPNELDEEKNYRRKSFQPTTKPYWEKAVNKLNRIMASQNFHIEWNDNDAKEYFTKEYPLFRSVLSYFKQIVIGYKISDPNGVLVLDLNLPVKEDAEGQLVTDDTKEIEPFATIFESEDVVMYENNDFALLLSEEKVNVEHGGRVQNIGLVFYLYDKTNIYRVFQTGKKVDYTFGIEVYYEHGLGYLPVWKLKGKPMEVINGNVYYESYYSAALPHLNEAIIIHSTNKGVRNKVSYPIRAYYEQPCTNKDCHDGSIITGSGDSVRHEKCGTCKGTGQVKFSPFRDYVHNLPDRLNDNDQVAFPGFAYVSPDGTIIKDNEEIIDKYLSTAFNFIHSGVKEVVSGQGTGQDKTAIESKIDREDEFVSMLTISDEVFELLMHFIEAAYQVRYGGESPIEISAPKTFELTTADELNRELESARAANMPSVVLSAIYIQYVQKKFPLNANVANIVEVSQYCDSLFTLDEQTIQMMQAGGNIEKWQVILHVNIDVFINQLLNEDENLFEKSNDEISQKLIAMAKAKEAEMSAGQNTAGNIINQIAGSVV